MSMYQGNVTPSQRDSQGFPNNLFQMSMLMLGDNLGGANLGYIGFAKPGSLIEEPVWQIKFLQYDGNGNVISITWPTDGSTDRGTNQFRYVWDKRAGYMYS